MPAPSNTTPETAFQITQLPFTQTLDVADAPTGTGYASTCDSTQYKAVWYRYTAGAAQEYLSVNASPSASPSYNPRVSIWTGAPLAQFTLTDPISSETQNFCSELGVGFYFNVPLSANTTYYFQVTDTSGAAHTSTVIFAVTAAPTDAAPAGSVVILDDFKGFPAAILSATAGTFLQCPATDAAGEFAATVATGEMCLSSDTFGTAIVFVDATFQTVDTWTAPTGAFVRAIHSNQVDTFYVLHIVTGGSGPAKVTAFSIAGVEGDTWTLPSDANLARMAAVAQDDTVYYYGTPAVGVVHAYDLINSLALPDLHAAFGAERLIGTGTGATLADGTILFMYGDASNRTAKLRLFDPAGAVLNTLALSDATFVYLNRWCLASDTAIWIWGHEVASTSPALFRLIALSDGSTTTSWSVPETPQSGFSTDAPFSISDSCPVFVLAAAIAPPAPEAEPVYHIRQLVRRRVRRAPIVWAEKSGLQTLVRVNLFAVDMQPGVGDTEVAEPVVMIKASKDGGRTWSHERQLSAGRVGEYTKRIDAWRWGSGRQWVFEIACTDAVTWYLVNALLDAEPGRN